MAIQVTRKLILICHSHKIVDEQVITLLSAYPLPGLQLINLANTEISIELLKEISLKLEGWQHLLVDPRYMDHSIKNPENEFLMMDDASKIIFLKNDSWLIGTPMLIDNDKAYRLHSVRDVVACLNVANETKPDLSHFVHHTAV